MGAKVVGISSKDSKKEAAMELGCDDFINANNAEDLARYRKKFTHILCTGTGKDFKCKPLQKKKKMKVSFCNFNLTY